MNSLNEDIQKESHMQKNNEKKLSTKLENGSFKNIGLSSLVNEKNEAKNINEVTNINVVKNINEAKNINENNDNILTSENIINDVENINTKLFLLDPLSVIIKLAILSYKPNGTKITIYNNVIYIQEPGPFQGICRMIMQSNKNDLQFLYNPINIACNKFLSPSYLQSNPSIKNLFICAQNGVKKLMETYKNHILLNIVLCYYNVILSNHIDGVNNKNNFYPDNLTHLYSDDLINKLNNIWTKDRINVILDLISFLLKYKENPNCKSLETIMDGFDIEYQKIIISLT